MIGLWVNAVAYSQNTPQIEVLTTEQGLTFRDVRAIAQDTFGYMWFGTQQGLNRYDGYTFKVYNSNKNNPNYIENDEITSNIKLVKSTNNLWYVANEKVFRLQLQTGNLTEFTDTNGIRGQVLLLYLDDFDQIWVITDDFWSTTEGSAKQYLQKYDGVNGFTEFAVTPRGSREFTHITTDRNQNVYWGTILRGVIKFSPEGKLLSEQKLGSFNWYGEEMFFGQSFFDKANNQYYFPKGRGVRGVLKKSKATHKFDPILEVSDVISHVIEDHQGGLLFAGNETLYRIDAKGNIQDLTKELEKHFDYSRINNLFQDANNLLWVATDNGLFKIRIKKQLFSQLYKSDKEGWGNTFRGIFETKEGNIIAICENQHKLVGVDTLGMEFDPPLKLKNRNTKTLIAGSRFLVFNKDSTAIYTVNENLMKINLEDGLITLFPEFKSRLSVTGANPLLGLKDGSLLFGYSSSKLTIFNPETNESHLVFSSVKESKNVSELRYFYQSKDSNIVWVGTQNKGLLKVNLQGSIEAQYNTQTVPALSNNAILVIYEDSNKLWVGTYGGGLDCLLLNENRITSFKKENGLPDNNVVGILPYQKDFLWLSTYNGLSLYNTKTKDFQNFFVEDGLTHNEFNYASFFIDSKGNYYFGGMNGITKFKPKPILKKREMPPMRFTSYSKFSSKTNEITTYDRTHQLFSEIDISPYDQYFTVSWTMPNYFGISKNQYYTKLDGFEDRWFFQGNSASIRYNKLPPGDYVLLVKGTDSNGNSSRNQLEIPIHVYQIFYKTWWFYILSILAVFGLTSFIFHYRLQQLKAISNLRTKISSDLHDDVGSVLSGLAMQTEMLELKAVAADKPKLNKIKVLSREAISKMRDLVWSIDNRRERTLDLIERMEELAEEMLIPKEISCQIKFGELNTHKKIAFEVKQELFFIFREAVTNVLRHSNATKVTVSFVNDSGLGSLKISDNGTESKQNSKTGIGLDNMKMRAKRINAEINFYSIDGFTIVIKLPFEF